MPRVVKEEDYAARRNEILDVARKLVVTLGSEITEPLTEVTLGFEVTVLLVADTLLLELREPFDSETVSFSWRVEFFSTVFAVLLSVESLRVTLEAEMMVLLLSDVDWFW